MFNSWVERMGLIMVCVTIGIMAILLVSVTAAFPGPQVSLEPDNTGYAGAGQTIIYNHTIVNSGWTTDTFLIESTSTRHWLTKILGGNYPTGTLVLPLQMGSQTSVNFQVSVTIPPNAKGSEITTITATSQFSPTVQDTAIDTTIVSYMIYLPLVAKRWPPVPYQPSGFHIDSFGTAWWSEHPERLADTYIVQRATDEKFTVDVHEVCNTFERYCDISFPLAGIYYYRVRGHNTWGYGPWSEAYVVTHELPGNMRIDIIKSSPIFNIEWYTRQGGPISRRVVQESTNADFSNSTVYIPESEPLVITKTVPGIYYYRVRAEGPTGLGEWSNTVTGVVPRANPEMVYVPGGQFIMGCSENCATFAHNAKPAHNVWLDAYYIGKHEVSNGQYAQCVLDGKCSPPRREDYNDPEYANFPVTSVSWYQAANYCAQTGGSLPTEAQWEKAARGTDGRWYPWGVMCPGYEHSCSWPSCLRMNFTQGMGGFHTPCVGHLTPVGHHFDGASPYKAIDMLGNASEYVNDWYSESYYSVSPYHNPTGPSHGTAKIVRGCSHEQQYFYCTTMSREAIELDETWDPIGFRCVKK